MNILYIVLDMTILPVYHSLPGPLPEIQLTLKHFFDNIVKTIHITWLSHSISVVDPPKSQGQP